MNIKYRKDLDGLRAIAVLLVVFAHASFPFVTGGFIGVDVFFVLSGFLITYMIKDELANQTFTISNFYLRRIRRLMPAYFTVTFVTSVAAAFLLLPDSLQTYTTSLVFSTFSLANFFFWQQGLDYFAPDSATQPLLHIWSLAVEEQFYVLWPLFLYLAFRYLRWQLTLAAIVAIFAISLLGSELGANSGRYRVEVYYLLPFRAFELLMGGLVALYYDRQPQLNTALSRGLSLLAIGLILLPAFMLTEQSPFPGINAFWPCLGTAILIVTGKASNGATTWLLSTGPMVWTGKLSYSLYLWHWPILAFMQYHMSGLTLASSVVAIALAFFLSWLTWRFVETPFRHKFLYDFKGTALRLFCFPALVPILALLSFQLLPNGYGQVDRAAFNEVDRQFTIPTLKSG